MNKKIIRIYKQKFIKLTQSWLTFTKWWDKEFENSKPINPWSDIVGPWECKREENI